LNTATVDEFSKNQSIASEQTHLLNILSEMPDELEITDPVYLEEIEGYIQDAEQGFDSEIVMDFAETVKKALTPKASYMKGAEVFQILYDDFGNSLNLRQKQTLLVRIADFHNWADYYEIAYEMIQEILPDIEDEYLRGWAYSTIGTAAQRLGRYDEGMDYYLSALAIFQEGSHSIRLAEIFNRIGNLYYNLEEYETSISYYQKYIDMAIEMEDEKSQANGYANIGAAHRQAGDFDRALQAYMKGVEISERIGNVMELARVKMNIANLYSSTEQFDKALQSYKESLAISEEYGITYGVMINQLNIGRLYFTQNLFQESEKAYMAAYEMMNREDHKHEMLSITEMISQLYEAMGDYQSAFTYIKLHDEISNEIFDSEKLEMTEDLRTKYETELKEQDLAIAEITISKQKLQKNALILLTISLTIILVMGTFYYRKRKTYYRSLYKKNLDVLNALGIGSSAMRNLSSGGDINESSEFKRELYEEIKVLFTDEKIYRDPNIKVSKIAKRVGSNRKYVSEAIKASTNMSFNTYLNFYRITEAKQMILKGDKDKSFTEIHMACGFSSRTTFYTAFKNFTGMSPSEFKKMRR
jgi:tetratricopeptide (TPR) repeat protein